MNERVSNKGKHKEKQTQNNQKQKNSNIIFTHKLICFQIKKNIYDANYNNVKYLIQKILDVTLLHIYFSVLCVI